MKKIYVLVRTSYRPKQFARCITSILNSVRPELYQLETFVGYDDADALRYIPSGCSVVECQRTDRPFGYNEYFNEILKRVPLDGHAILLDDDDELIPNALATLAEYLKPEVNYIVPFLRDEFQKPTPRMMHNRVIRAGYIGMPCLVLWTGMSPYLKFSDSEFADFEVISRLNAMVNLRWLNLPLIKASPRGRGAMEKKFGNI